MRRVLDLFVVTLFSLCLCWQLAAAQPCTAINSPTAEYFGPIADGPTAPLDPIVRFGLGTEKCSLGTPGTNTTICRDSDNNVEARFSNVLSVRQVPFGGWATWSSPPESESSTPIVGWNTTTSLTVTLADGFLAGIAGMEIEPQQFGTFNITAVFRNLAGASLITISRNVVGFAGARLFAAICDEELINSIVITTNDVTGFAIAKVRADSYVFNRDVPPAAPAVVPLVPNLAKGNAAIGRPK